MLVRWKKGHIGMYVVAAIGQCLPLVMLFTSCDVAVMNLFACSASSLVFLLLWANNLAIYVALGAVALQGVCLVGASVVLDAGLLPQCQPVSSAATTDKLVEICNHAMPLILMGGLCWMQHSTTELLVAHLPSITDPCGRTLQIMSHELRTPLHVISSHAESLTQREGIVGEWGEVIAVQCSQMSLKIAMLMDLVQLEDGNLQPIQQPLSIRRIVSSAINSMKFEAAEKDLKLQFLPSIETPHNIIGDEQRTLSVLYCLLHNAVKCSFSGGVVKLLSSEVELPDGSYAVQFTVQDSGVGMDAETSLRMQGHQEQHHEEGMGTGLRISRFWAKRLGGALSLTSDGPGLGCIAIFTVPTHQPSPQPMPQELHWTTGFGFQLQGVPGAEAAALQLKWLGLHEALVGPSTSPGPSSSAAASGLSVRLVRDGRAATVRSGSTRRSGTATASAGTASPEWNAVAAPVSPVGLLDAIQHVTLGHSCCWPRNVTRALIVDDSPMNRKLLRLKLESWATFECDEAENGSEAVALAEGALAPYDIILMDVDMPVMNGLQATRKIRHLEIFTPIFAVTANTVQSVTDECLKSGMNGVFEKPLRWPDLRDTIYNALLLDDTTAEEDGLKSSSQQSLTKLLQETPRDAFHPIFSNTDAAQSASKTVPLPGLMRATTCVSDLV